MMAFCGVFFMNSMANSLTTTGAFEVLLDGEVVYSKLETGRMPNGRQVRSLGALGGGFGIARIHAVWRVHVARLRSSAIEA